MLNKYFYNLSVTIVGIVVSIFILTTVGGLFHISVNPFFVFIPFIGGLYYLKKQSEEKLDFFLQLTILILIILISYFLAISIWDVSWDGRSSHIATAILYKNGWLPVYQNYQEFAKLCHVYPASAFWGNCYLRFTEIVGANIYKLTDLVESAKAINFILLSAVFMYSFCVLKLFGQNKFITAILSLIVVLNPVCICQWFTNYIDLILYSGFALLVMSVIKIEIQKCSYKTDIFMFVASALILAMTKFTGSMYLFVICIIYFVYLILLKRDIKKYIKTVFLIGILIAVTGISPFFTNIRDYENPFYPLFGKNKINISNENIPYNFKNKSSVERFIISTFSETLNSMDDSVDKIEIMKIPHKLKIPFTVNIESNFHLFYCADMRLGGFGYFWSGILLLSIISLFVIRFRNENEKYLFWLIFSIITVTTLSNPEYWWARYVPQLWLLPLIITVFGSSPEKYKNNFSKNFKKYLSQIILLSYIANSLIVLCQNTEFNIKLTKEIKKPYEKIYNNSKLYIMTRPEWENMVVADETIRPHIEEILNNIIDVPYDELKIKSGEFAPIQKTYIVHWPCYFFKIEKNM